MPFHRPRDRRDLSPSVAIAARPIAARPIAARPIAARPGPARPGAAIGFHAVAEPLEPRWLCSTLRTIGGTVFHDLNDDARRQLRTEHLLAGVTIFLDLNGNGQLDPGEPSAITNKHGAFAFKKLARGTYDVVVQPPAGDKATLPSAGVIVFNAFRHGTTSLHFGVGPGARVTTPPPDTQPPTPALGAASLTTPGNAAYAFTVTWTDPAGVNVSSFGDGTIVATGPGGFNEPGNLVALDQTTNGSPRTTTYQIAAPAGGWSAADDGLYTLSLVGAQVADMLGNVDPAMVLGTFDVSIAATTPAAPVLTGGANGVTAFNNSSADAALTFSLNNLYAGATLTLLADAIAVASADVTATSATLRTSGGLTLADGPHAFTLVENLPNGVTTTSAPQTVIVDTTPPTAALSTAPAPSAGDSASTFTVGFTDANGVAVASLQHAILVTGPGGFSQTASLVSVDVSTPSAPAVVATYSLAPAGGQWTSANNGTYAVHLMAGVLSDTVANLAGGASLGQFSVNIGAGASAPPAAPVLLAVSDTGTYSNDGLTDLNNASPARALQFSIGGTSPGARVSLLADGNVIASATATSTTTTLVTNGSVTLADGAHRVTARQTDPGRSTSADSFPDPLIIETQAPAADSTPQNVGGAGASIYTFSVVYRDAFAVDAGHLQTGNVVVNGPGGFTATATLEQVSAPGNGSPRTATYAFTPPGGTWQPADNGLYTISLQGGQIFDTAGNAAPAQALATFTVNAGVPTSPTPLGVSLSAISDTGVSTSDGLTNLNNSSAAAALQFVVSGTVAGATVSIYSDGTLIGSAAAAGAAATITTDGTTTLASGSHAITARQTLSGDAQSGDSPGVNITIDTTPPTAALNPAPDITAAGASPYVFSVTYADATAVNVASLQSGNVVVSGTIGANLPVTLVSTSSLSDAGSLTATYRLDAPAGGWATAANGTYTIALQDVQVDDTAGNFSPAQTLGTFQINVPQPVSPAPAAAVLSAQSDTGVSSSDDLTNLNNSSPAAALQLIVAGTVAGANVSLYCDGTLIGGAIATGSSTTITTDGVTALASGAHAITAAQTVPGSLASPVSPSLTFTIDTTPPTAALTPAGDITVADSTPYVFSVTYADASGVDVTSLSNSNVVISGPLGTALPAMVTHVAATASQPTIVATYQFDAPSGGWAFGFNGTYTIALQAAQISDIAGNVMAGQTLGSFNVNVPQPVSATTAAPVLAAASDSGESSSDGVTSFNSATAQTVLQFTVASTTPGATVTLYANGAAVGSAVALSDTTTISTTPGQTIADGVVNFSAAQTAPGDQPSAISPATPLTIETTAPAAVATLPGTITDPSANVVSVSFTDAVALQAASITAAAITVTAPDGVTTLPLTLVTVSPAADSPNVDATFAIIMPGGAWTAANNGVYTVALVGGQVLNIAGNPAPAGVLGTFSVNVP